MKNIKNIKGKSPSDSIVVMEELVMPNHSNPQGTIFGGQVMSWIDIAAAMCCIRHARSQVVTVHVDAVTFTAPVKVGHHIRVKAKLNYVGNTSMEVGVEVESENPLSGEIRSTTSALLTFVALDEFGKPKKVFPLLPQTELEKKLFDEGKARALARKKNN